MQVIGTAGHVDHGKSTLINKLTGINPDRLKTERDREMTIELGFAWFSLPNGSEIGIVDVPGHRDFIENMLSGIGGIDAVLFVVAADEGVMPQTREHLAILNLLQIPTGVVALTKTDLVTEPGWLELVKADLRDTFHGTVLEKAPIIPVSARTGEGIDALINALQSALSKYPHRPDLGRPRLPVDRVFVQAGFGTIVTGTLSDGCLTVGDEIQILPKGIKGRIRGLQTHKQIEQNALPGSRTAVNITGISVDEINRGDVLAHPGDYQSTTMLDVYFQLLPDAEAPLKHDAEVKLFLGAAEVLARVRLLGVQECKPGDDVFLQLVLQKPVIALRGDRFIIRRPSPPETIGGGQVLDPHPTRRYRRFNQERINALEHLLMGTPEDILLQTAFKLGPAPAVKLMASSGLEEKTAQQALSILIEQETFAVLNPGDWVIPQNVLLRFQEDVLLKIETFHHRNPLKPGMSREQLKNQIAVEAKFFDAIIGSMARQGILLETGADLQLTGHEIKFTPQQQEQIKTLLQEYDGAPYAPPSYKQSVEQVGEDVLRALINTGQLMRIEEDVLLKNHVFEEMRELVIDRIESNGSITLAELRDAFNTSRKYAVAVLEYLDQTGVTARRGDARVLRKHQS